MRDITVVTFVGKSNSGKTTFLEKFIADLTARGYRLATVKHHPHVNQRSDDEEGRDSWRHAQAGAVMSMVSGPDKFSLFRSLERELTLTEIAQEAAKADCDVLIAEGFKRENYPKIELSRKERSDEALFAPSELEALVTNNEDLAEAYRGEVAVFDLNDIAGFTDFFEGRFLKEQS